MPETLAKPRERPLIYGPEMVCALLEGRKTQTRRVFDRQPTCNEALGYHLMSRANSSTSETNRIHRVVRDAKTRKVLEDREYNQDLPEWLAGKCPLGKVGDRLWVRETHAHHAVVGWLYRADQGPDDGKPPGGWRPSIHMPREACRIVLTITGVRAERVQEITPSDILAEGINRLGSSSPFWGWREDEWYDNAFTAFANLWDEMNPGRLAWANNPWTSVVTFTVEVAGA